jgi:hypothetical protein
MRIQILNTGVEVPNSQCISCLDSSLGRVLGAGDPGSIPGGGKLNVCLPKDDPGQNSIVPIKQQCFGSGYALIRIDVGRLDPDPNLGGSK